MSHHRTEPFSPCFYTLLISPLAPSRNFAVWQVVGPELFEVKEER